MHRFTIIISTFLIISINAIDYSTCARMDVPFLDKATRGMCVSGCNMKNCTTGYCEKRGDRPTCVCSGCNYGGHKIPLETLMIRDLWNLMFAPFGRVVESIHSATQPPVEVTTTNDQWNK